MVDLTGGDGPAAHVYGDRDTKAVKSVLTEIGQILGSFRGQFVVIGGAVPWLLIESDDMPHVGTIDIDLALDAEALGDGEYADLIGELEKHGYHRMANRRRFQLARTVSADDGGPDIDIVVDFLMPRDAEIVRNKPPLINDFAVQRADGADLALAYQEVVAIEGTMPDGSWNRARLAVCSIPAFLAMKGHAIANRKKHKDAYDIYWTIRNFEDGLDALAEACRPLLDKPSAQKGFGYIAEKFESPDHVGPKWVRTFAVEENILAERTPEQWQLDAFGQVDTWLRALGVRA